MLLEVWVLRFVGRVRRENEPNRRRVDFGAVVRVSAHGNCYSFLRREARCSSSLLLLMTL